ncbi:MAG: threonine--tRNA ligase [Candidatus Buchananbacteria bacterium]|nr:threonine--tRNA ligase [Candidatus Buchananbacteria bacterium]
MDEKLLKIRHTASHVMAQAVLELFPDAKIAIGPAIEDGFYYDFDFGKKMPTDDDLKEIEKVMKHIIKQNQKMEQYDVETDEAIKYLKKKKQPYKVELAEDLKKEGEKKLSFYVMVAQDGKRKFNDMCAGPHVKSTKEIGAVKLMKLAGAYWRGNEKNKMLTRIYGTAFASENDLKQYLDMLAEAEKRDHRKLGKELGLFVFSELIGPGMPMYTPKGALIRKLIINYSNELQGKIGYQEVHTPNINKAELFKISGHYDKYKDDMLEVKSHYTDEQYYLKPMNCPQHTQIYASQLRSYKDLPIRFADFSNLYRDEKPGELNGLARLRCFAQDDGHCFCREDQIQQEFNAVLEAIKEVMKTYKMDYWIRLSLRDKNHKEKYIGEDQVWDKAEGILESILKDNKIEYKIGEGEAAFYGPKMDLMAKDAIGREWQLSTIQIDFSMPNRFGLRYIDKDGSEKTPVMIHRALIGSPERFLGILIEHYAGAFPVWLAPIQVQIIPVGADFVSNCQKLAEELKSKGIRVEVDQADETVGNKIRKAEKSKVPYMLVIGEKEAKSKDLQVRIRGKKEVELIGRDEFFDRLVEEIHGRK